MSAKEGELLLDVAKNNDVDLEGRIMIWHLHLLPVDEYLL